MKMKSTMLLLMAVLLMGTMAASAIPVRPGQWATLKNIKKNTDGSIEFDLDLGSATGVTSIDNSLLTTDDYYDLQGRRISQPTHGIYIHNGKKVVIQ